MGGDAAPLGADVVVALAAAVCGTRFPRKRIVGAERFSDQLRALHSRFVELSLY